MTEPYEDFNRIFGLQLKNAADFVSRMSAIDQKVTEFIDSNDEFMNKALGAWFSTIGIKHSRVAACYLLYRGVVEQAFRFGFTLGVLTQEHWSKQDSVLKDILGGEK